MRQKTAFTPTLLAGAALALSVVSGAAYADPDSETLLARAADKLHNAHTLTAAFTIRTLHPTRYADTQEIGTVQLAKPNKARVEITRYRKPVDADRWIASGNGSLIVADGQNVSTVITHPGNAQYRTESAASAAPIRLLSSLPVLQAFFDADTASLVKTRTRGHETWEGASYVVVEATIADKSREEAAPTTREIYVGADGLIHRTVTHTQVKGKAVQTEVALHKLKLDAPISGTRFVFNPPANAVPFERVASQPLLTAGTEAPDFQVQDVHGKSLRLSDLRGKVVVLKFFATWCWTCRQSLPDTEALAQRYADKNVVVLAVDIWNGREAFAQWTKQTPYHAIRFVHDDAPQGKDAASLLYHVSATPTEYVIGRDGRIVASSVGYEGHSTTLEQAVETALSNPQSSRRE